MGFLQAASLTLVFTGTYEAGQAFSQDTRYHTVLSVTGINGTEDLPLPVPGLSITDVDLNDGSVGFVTVTLQAGQGTISMSWHTNTTSTSPNERNSLDNDLTGLNFLVGSALAGVSTSFVQFSATVEIANAALATMTYTTFPFWFGNDVLTVSVSDNGYTGLGGALMDTISIPITILPVNNPPELFVYRAADGTNLVRRGHAFVKLSPVLYPFHHMFLVFAACRGGGPIHSAGEYTQQQQRFCLLACAHRSVFSWL